MGDKAFIMGDNRDQSMEEILASIKRVIAEEGEAAARPRASKGRAQQPASEDVLELSDPVTEANGLISSEAAEASRARIAALTAARQQGGTAPATAPGAPLESVIREMLKPMLKDWLDQNLPDIVEEIVTREIARISGKPA